MADRTVKVSLIAQASNYIAGMEEAAKRTRKLGDSTDDVSKKLAAQRDAMNTVGTGLLAIGAVAAAGIGLAVSKFAEFDEAMSNVQAATHETADNMSLLRDAAIDAGASTVFSATEAANAIEELSKAGVSTADIIGGALSGALDLASAGQLDVARAAEIAATAMTQFGLAGTEVPHIADLLAAGAGKAQGSVEDLAQALNQGGLVASQTGLSIEETTAGLSAFAAAGLTGSDAGTSFKSMLQRLTPQSAEAQAAMDELGISAYDAQGNFIGLEGFAGNLQTSLADLTTEQRNSALATIFGSDAVRAASVLYANGSEGIAEWTSKVDDSGYAAETARARMDNLNGDLEKLGGAFDTALIQTGSGANDVLRVMVQTLTGLIDIVGGLPAPVLGGALAIGAVAAATALAGGAFLAAVPKIAEFKAGLTTLGVSAKGAGLAIAGMSAGLALVGLVITKMVSDAAETAAAVSELTDTFDEQTGAVTALTRATVAKKLSDEGVFETAKKAGISQKEFTDAVLEGGKALDDVKDKINAYGTVSLVPWSEKDAAARQLNGALEEQSGRLESAKDKFGDLQAAQAGSTETSLDAGEAYLQAADDAAALNDEVLNLVNSINEANGVGQDAVSSNAAYQESLAGIKDQVDASKKAYEEAHGTLNGWNQSLDESTVSGSANAASLSEIASKAQTAAKAQYELDVTTMGTKGATDKYVATLGSSRQALIDGATAAGYNADEVQNLANKVFGLPSAKEIAILAETSNAAARVDTFIRSYNGRSITLAVRTSGAVTGPAGVQLQQANGGVVDYYANGGLAEAHVAQIAPAGAMRVWAEPETGGEAYIPLASSKRARSLSIWEETGRRLKAFANGGFDGPSAPIYVGGGSTEVSLADTPVTLWVDGQPMRGIIKQEISGASQVAARSGRAGVRPIG